MKKRILFLFMLLVVVFGSYNYKMESVITDVKSYEAGDALEVGIGTYTSKNGLSFVVNSDGTITYDGATLTLKENLMGNTLTGKVGTEKKSVTFYQVNSSTFISKGYTLNQAVITYTDSSGDTVNLYDYIGFKLDVTPVANSEGIFDVYHDGTKVNSYLALQDAVDAASNGDTIKITDDYVALEGAYINKDLTIDGLSHTIDRSGFNHSVFVVEEGSMLNLKNITIDGGADEWEVDFDSVTFLDYYIPLKEGSIANDPKLTLSAVISKGDLVTDNVSINNNYTTSYGAALNVVSGSVTLKNSKFNHNFGNIEGGAIFVGSNLYDKTVYPVDSLLVNNCEFKDNYVANSNNASKYGVGHGGAIDVLNTNKVEIKDSYFYGNVAYYGKGGAVDFRDQTTSNVLAEDLGLDFYQASITDSVFEYNWAGNDGFAIQSYAADLYIDGCTFKKNVGTHPSSSVGTVSVESYRSDSRIYSSIKNSTFEENIGPVSGYGDHSSKIDADFENLTFKGNIGNESILLYSAVSNFKNCKFVDEKATYGIIDARIYENHEIPPSITLEDVTFENTDAPADVLTRKQGHNAELNTYNVTLKGETSGNIVVLNNNKVTVEGTHTGNITADGNTSDEHIVVNEDAKLVGDIITNPNTYTVVVTWPSGSGYVDPAILYLEKDKIYTEEEFFLEHQLMKDGYKLVYYTDSKLTTLWDYKVSGNMTLYTAYEEHEHAYDGTLVVYKYGIYEQCSCGFINRQLGFTFPEDLYYDGKAKNVSLINTLEVSSDDYTLVYFVKDKNGNYVAVDGNPITVGDYKVVLTYGTNVVEAEYSIIEKPVNPSTGIITPYIICGLITIVGVVGTILYRKKKFM